MYRIDRSRQAEKDAETCKRAGYKKQLNKIMETIERNPYEPTQFFEKLVGNLKNMYSRHINYHNRVVYSVFPNTENARDDNGDLYDGIVRIHESWGHEYKN
jgi:Txe/YoeB family toxin of toxin-antitoxin system